MEILKGTHAALERKIQSESYEVEIGGMTAGELHNKFYNYMEIDAIVTRMIQSPAFSPQAKQEKIRVVRLTPQDLGLTSAPKTDQLYKQAQTLDLDLCPAETGPHARLQGTSQPMYDSYYIAMIPITVKDPYVTGNHPPCVFLLDHYPRQGFRLAAVFGGNNKAQDLNSEWLFRLRK